MKKELPKSYMTDAEREELLAARVSQNVIYLAESEASAKAKDKEATWGWLALVEFPAHALLSLKQRRGAQFIRDMGFSTKKADAEYGPDWLDRDAVVGITVFD
ncbi:hypothetical protein [Bartonella harrusi]|uniref:Phage related protein n=1 Tax=Bartonella harrusi TaxID=2961895 RepID=A0ABY5ER23_9HYPH|nr:hypothetical protein [Bartonella harrusi]UTO27844.1 hypothetical protein NMK50_06250 [Bartonella harrusi]